MITTMPILSSGKAGRFKGLQDPDNGKHAVASMLWYLDENGNENLHSKCQSITPGL